jgi:secondary thiamine-phosphate synthase enzyme
MTALTSFEVRTKSADEWVDVTNLVRRAVAESGVEEGICVVFVPHTTAALTLNENSDPDVVRDARLQLGTLSPKRNDYRHGEGNSDAHVKTSLFGPSLTLIVSQGLPLLGTWQAVWFTEFDGPRTRKLHVRVMGD